jgi:hypothetical protein
MRAYHVIAAVAVILVGIGLTLPFSAAPIAEADSRSTKTVSVDVSSMHQNIESLPVQEFHDMTFVFPVVSGGD